MFRLTKDEAEYASLRSQIATSNSGRGGTRYLPYAFTELGVAMLSSVLTSETAININRNATHWGLFPLRRFLQEIVYLWERTLSPFLA